MKVNFITIGISWVMFLVQLVVLWLNCRMIRFSVRYGKQWSLAWKVFFVGMVMALVRRVMFIYWSMGYDGEFGKWMQWTDHVVITVVLNLVWLVFLIILWRWWNSFFQTYLKPSKEIKELVIEKPEKIVILDPKNIEVKEK